MLTGRTKREMAVLLGGLAVFALLIAWGQARSVRTQAGPITDTPLYAERLARATLAAGSETPVEVPVAATKLKRPTYVETCWDFYSYESYAFAWFLATNYSPKYTTAQIQKLSALFGDALKRTYPNANKLYRSMVITRYPRALAALQRPSGSAEDILRAAPFSKPLSTFGATFSRAADYKYFTAEFLRSYGKLAARSRPIPVAQLSAILVRFGEYLRATDDCVTINTAAARAESAKQAQSCALVCVSQAQMSCGVCVATLGVTVASCSQMTCGAGAITCGSGVQTCGATCGNSQTCLGVSCSAVSCSGATCSGTTCGAGATCSGKTCGVACK